MNPRPFGWQQAQWQQLAALHERGRLPHGLMLAGPEEIGKRHFALCFAQYLLCHGVGESRPCGGCKACHLFQASTHPDFLRIEPEEEGKAIKVDQIRKLGDFATRTASLGESRVIVLCPAEAMNLNAANAFLKTLEEPGDGVVLILVTHQAGLILPTIRSRCRILGFPLPLRAPVLDWLSRDSASGEDVAEAILLSGGRPLRARRLLDTELKDQLHQFQQAMAALEQRLTAPLEAARVLQGLPKSDALEWFQYAVYERIKAARRGSAGAEMKLFRFLDRLTTARQRLLGPTNPNPQLVWEEILMDWKSVIDLPN